MDTQSTAPLIRITCKRANNFWVGNSARQGMLITAEDVRLLRTLAERDFSVSLVCPGLPTYHAPVKALLRRLLPVPGEPQWYVPTSLTGPLRQALPERAAP